MAALAIAAKRIPQAQIVAMAVVACTVVVAGSTKRGSAVCRSVAATQLAAVPTAKVFALPYSFSSLNSLMKEEQNTVPDRESEELVIDLFLNQ